MKRCLESNLAELEARLQILGDAKALKLFEGVRFNAINVMGQLAAMESTIHIHHKRNCHLADYIRETKKEIKKT